MGNVLKGLACFIWAAGLGAWLVAGANTGWTRTQEQVKVVDDVTGIEGVEWRPVFRPGIDVLALAAVVGAGAWGLGWWLSRASRVSKP